VSGGTTNTTTVATKHSTSAFAVTKDGMVNAKKKLGINSDLPLGREEGRATTGDLHGEACLWSGHCA
jgi:hypothetical protein